MKKKRRSEVGGVNSEKQKRKAECDELSRKKSTKASDDKREQK